VNPAENKEGETKLQTVLKQKLGDGAVPFTLQVFKFPILSSYKTF